MIGRRRLLSLAPLAFLPPALLHAQETARPKRPDVIYEPTPPAVVDAMLDLARVRRGDVLYDLGSGDGRIPIRAAQRVSDLQATGIEIDPKLLVEARENAVAAGVADRVRFLEADLFTTDFSAASVVTLYLMNWINEKLRPKLLAELNPGTRVVSHHFDMGSWKPDAVRTAAGRRIFLWTIPARRPTPGG